MKILLLSIVFSVLTQLTMAQSPEYLKLIRRADSLYRAKDFRGSASAYSKAFRLNGWKGRSGDRYNAACSWALSEAFDSAFFQLNKIATSMNYQNYAHITTDPDLKGLHADGRWA